MFQQQFEEEEQNPCFANELVLEPLAINKGPPRFLSQHSYANEQACGRSNVSGRSERVKEVCEEPYVT